MPTTYSHYSYGADVLKLLDAGTRNLIEAHRGLYDIGVHGPDVVFYFHAFRKNKVNQYGVKLHHEPASDFFRFAMEEYRRSRDKDAAKAYLAGFMTHFILDSTCHPYIRRRIRQTGISHTEIETDFDALLMESDGLNPRAYRPACHMKLRWDYARVIAPFFRMNPLLMLGCLFDMKLVLNHIFRSHFGVKRAILHWVSRHYYPNLHLQQYFVKEKINPGNGETCEKLLKLYHGSQPICAKMIVKLMKALDEQDPVFLGEARLQKIFS